MASTDTSLGCSSASTSCTSRSLYGLRTDGLRRPNHKRVHEWRLRGIRIGALQGRMLVVQNIYKSTLHNEDMTGHILNRFSESVMMLSRNHGAVMDRDQPNAPSEISQLISRGMRRQGIPSWRKLE